MNARTTRYFAGQASPERAIDSNGCRCTTQNNKQIPSVTAAKAGSKLDHDYHCCAGSVLGACHVFGFRTFSLSNDTVALRGILLADLVCAAALFPVLFGLYSRRLTGPIAFWSTLLGIGAGALFFPRPDFSPWNGLPFSGDLLISFALPVVVSFLVSMVWIQAKAQQGQTAVFDFNYLDKNIRAYDETKMPTKAAG